MEISGGQGNVMNHHKTIKDMEQYYSKMGDNKDVKEFLKNITSDKDGFVHYTFVTRNKFLKHNSFPPLVFCIYSPGLALWTMAPN